MMEIFFDGCDAFDVFHITLFIWVQFAALVNREVLLGVLCHFRKGWICLVELISEGLSQILQNRIGDCMRNIFEELSIAQDGAIVIWSIGG